MEYSIVVDNVTKSYRKQKILDGVSFNCEPGNIYGIIGRNGSGKTVLFRIISGLAKADSGSVTVHEKQVGKEIDFPENMGLIIEHPGFLFTSSGYNNLKYMAGIQKKIGEKEIKKAMESVGLDWKSRKWVGRYSLGMRQRLGIAQAIMEDPDIIILDEPMNGLDRSGIEDIRKILLDLKKKGKTILLASHNEEDIELLCDEVYRMEDGKLRSIHEDDMELARWRDNYPKVPQSFVNRLNRIV